MGYSTVNLRNVLLADEMTNDAPPERRDPWAFGAQRVRKYHALIARFGHYPARSTWWSRTGPLAASCARKSSSNSNSISQFEFEPLGGSIRHAHRHGKNPRDASTGSVDDAARGGCVRWPHRQPWAPARMAATGPQATVRYENPSAVREAERLIAEARNQRSPKLSLAGLRIRSLPASLQTLAPFLEELDLSDCWRIEDFTLAPRPRECSARELEASRGLSKPGSGSK